MCLTAVHRRATPAKRYSCVRVCGDGNPLRYLEYIETTPAKRADCGMMPRCAKHRYDGVLTVGGPQYDTQNDERRAENSHVCCTRGQKGFRCYGSTVKYMLVVNNRIKIGCNWRRVGLCPRLMNDERRKKKNNKVTEPEVTRCDLIIFSTCVTSSKHDGFQSSYVGTCDVSACAC